MSVTLDAPPQPMWRVQCDHPGCGARLYLYGATEYDALRRARLEYGWSGDDERQLLPDTQGAAMSLSLFLEDEGCCLREPGHIGPCTWGCPDCSGTGRCWACGGYNPGDDLGSGCTECDGWGTCTYCGGDGIEGA